MLRSALWLTWGGALLVLMQLLEDENAQQTAMVMAMVDRVDKLEQDLHDMQEEHEKQRNSRWGMFSLQAR